MTRGAVGIAFVGAVMIAVGLVLTGTDQREAAATAAMLGIVGYAAMRLVGVWGR